MEGNESLASAGGQGEEDALPVVRHGRQDTLNGGVLVVAALEVTTTVLKWHCGKAVAPGVLDRKYPVPEFIWRGVLRDLALSAGFHVNAVDALAVGGVGEPDRQLAGIVLGLAYALRDLLIPSLGLDHSQLGIAVFQHVIGDERLGAPALALNTALGDLVLAPNSTTFDHAPPCCLQGRVNMLGAGFGLVHSRIL